MFAVDHMVIRYKCMEPRPEIDAHIKKALERMMEEAPSVSAVHVVLVKVRARGFTGLMRVSSSQGEFFAKARDERLLGLFTKLLEKVERQLQSWRDMRFKMPEEGEKPYQGEIDRESH